MPDKHSRKLSIRFKFFSLAILFLMVTVGTMSAIEIATMRALYIENLHKQSAMVARSIRAILYRNLEYLPLDGFGGMSAYLSGLLKEYKDISYCYVTDDGGMILYHSSDPGSEGKKTAALKARFDKDKKDDRPEMIHTGNYFETVLPLRKGGDVVGTIRVGVSRDVVGSIVRKIIFRNLSVFLVVLTFSSGLMYLLFTIGITKPLFRLADRLAHLSSRLGLDMDPREGGYELDDLAVSFEVLAEGLEKKTISEEYVQGAIKDVKEALLVTDQDGKIRMANTIVCELLGYNGEELRGSDIKSVFRADDLGRLGLIGGELAAMASAELLKAYDVTMVGKGDNSIPVLASVSAVADDKGNFKGAIWTMQDISSLRESEDELKRLNEDLRKNERAVLNMLSDLKKSHEDLKNSQDQLVRQAKLASLGRLVSDMAHEVNNPLMVISGRAQLGLMEGTTPQEINENLGIIVDQCARAKEIIERLLVFSRPSKGTLKEVNINDIVDFVAKLLEYQYAITNVKIIRGYDAKIPNVLMDEKQMHEVFMNIIKNSAEAMPHGGTIKITTRMTGDNVAVEIADTGTGIPASMMNEIFDPFFTTKEHGTGLGLAVCYGIVKSHGGEINYKSTYGKGTTATVLIPTNKKES